MRQKGNTRSRTECLTCRKRHVRCDEKRPSCQKCLAAQRSCIYSPAVVPLRDRRMLQRNAVLPGQQAPWSLTNTGPRLLAGEAIDPFDTLPIKMPLKSQELYHYFHQCRVAFAVAPTDSSNDCMAMVTLDEHALRSTILIAGIHYSWNAGSLKAYNSTFLFHKIESIQIINKWLQTPNSKILVACVRQILTICLAEACLGNISAAETHINGTMALLDSHGHRKDDSGETNDIGVELSDRYLLLTSCFIACLKSRLQDFRSLRATQGIDVNDDNSSAEALELMKIWHAVEEGGLDTRLKAMRMFPYFFSAPPLNLRPRNIDTLPIIDCLRSVTKTVDQFRINPTAANCNQIWNEGGPTRLMLELVKSHVWSFGKDERSDSTSQNGLSQLPLQSSWVGIVAAMELYMHSVLHITNAGEPIECRLLYRVLLMVKRDIEQTHDHLSGDHGTLCQSLWFWKAFTGALSLARSKGNHSTQVTPCSRVKDLDVLYEWFAGCVRAWSAATEKTDWKDIISALQSISWPAVMSPNEKMYAASLLHMRRN